MKGKGGRRMEKGRDQITENGDSEPGVSTQMAGPLPHFPIPIP